MSLRAENITLRRSGRAVLEDATFAPQPGECYGILGANGAGKTSLLMALTGILHCTIGTVVLDDAPLLSLPGDARARRIAYLAQQRIC